MYKVVLTFTIWSQHKSAEKLTVPFSMASRETTLPFPPFVGLSFHFQSDVAWQPITRVSWNDKEQSFLCNLEDQHPSGEIREADYDDLKEWATAGGWTVHEQMK